MSAVTVALIGGGRWGQTHATVLAQLPTGVERVLWVSRHNRDALSAFIAAQPGARDRFIVLDSLEAALARSPDAAIVATPAAHHVSTAEALLRGGVPTLVEKPLALSVDDARRLVDLATTRAVPLLVGLHLLRAPFLTYFLNLTVGRAVAAVHADWLDPDMEIWRGASKVSNLTTHKADEIIPHLWSLLHRVSGGEQPVLDTVKPLPLGGVEVLLALGRAQATLRFGRRAPARRRWLRLEFSDGGFAELDFAVEPGSIVIDNVKQRRFEPAGKPGPLATELSDFLDLVRSGGDFGESTQLAMRCIGSVELAAVVRTRLIEEEARATAVRLAQGHGLDHPDISAWIVDNFAPLLALPEPRSPDERLKLTAQIIDAVEAARRGLLGPSEGPPTMTAAIRASRFFQIMAGHSPA